MLRFVMAALAAWTASGCSGASIRSQEGHACSTNSSDDPQLICTPAADLVCISTYSRTVTNMEEAKKWDGGIRPVYVCRFACNTTAECTQANDICCRGHIFGKTYNKMGGCVPPGSCDTDETPADAGSPGDAPAPADTARPADGAAPADTAAPTPDAPAADAGAPGADAASGS